MRFQQHSTQQLILQMGSCFPHLSEVLCLKVLEIAAVYGQHSRYWKPSFQLLHFLLYGTLQMIEVS